jgi:AcrR family transcriptional regulator
MSEKRPNSRSAGIVEAALACISENGIDNTSIGDIRRRSGASIGSIYHHFGGKEDLVAAVYAEGLARYNASFSAELARSDGARDGVMGMVGHHLQWVAEQPGWARCLLDARRAEITRSRQKEISALNRAFVHQISAWIRRQVGRGGLARRIPVDLFLCLILGPCQEYARYWLDGQAGTDLDVARERLGQAAWSSLLPYRDSNG